MSKISITPNASGTGVFTISSPATSTDRTLTLPDEAGTVLTSVSSIASANLTGSVPSSALPAGSVLQVVSYYDANLSASTSSSSFVASSATLSITPSSATSKVLGFFSLTQVNTASANTQVQIALYRDGSSLGGIGNFQSTGQLLTSMSTSRLDTPNTTSAVVYTIYFRLAQGSGPAYLQDGGSIVLMEIAG